MNPDACITCLHCDLLHRREPLPPRGVAVCRRCGAVLYREECNSINRTLAFALAGTILFLIANFQPFLTLYREGQAQQTMLIGGIIELFRQGMPVLALLVLATGIVFPLLELSGLIYVMLPLKFNRIPWAVRPAFRLVGALRPWGMTEVFLLGILVSIVKLKDQAQIIAGPALYAFVGLVFITAAAEVCLNRDAVWRRLPVKR